uniref:Uncharacterized protein n=1 Tax=Siphoviridae sp. ctxMM9 TaxID=2827973 RepID=A0A8S5T726_9CAUD|nr:MAG TPA: hypothetical protein [Siphoviridae sp. ctxMM9]
MIFPNDTPESFLSDKKNAACCQRFKSQAGAPRVKAPRI